MLIRTDESVTVRRPHGVAYLLHADGRQEERDILICRHCQYTMVIVPGSGRRRGWCHRCAGPLCGKQRCMTQCEPFERWLEAVERKYRELSVR
jgi:hypothetical protein